MTDFSSLEKAAHAAQRSGVGGFVCQPHEILRLIEELRELREFVLISRNTVVPWLSLLMEDSIVSCGMKGEVELWLGAFPKDEK